MDLRSLAMQTQTALAARYPGRVVTRSLLGVDERDDEELGAGVLTILTFAADDLAQQAGMGADTGTAHLLITGQLFAGRDADGEAVEDAEIQMFQQIRDFALAPGDGLCPLDLDSVQFSGQQIAPYGWVRCELRYSELD